jgi:type IV pilus assembly protein PilY1
VLDITVPNDPDLLAEFTDEELGFTTSYPAIARLETTEGFTANPKNEDDSWFFLVGSGPDDYDGSRKEKGHMFVFDLNSKELVGKFDTNEEKAFMNSPITIDPNLNYNVESIYIGESYQNGEVYSPEIEENVKNMEGKMHRISTRNNADPAVWAYQTDPANWNMTTLLSSDAPLTAPATSSIDKDNNIWVYFGTGIYYSYFDEIILTPQSFYGIKDPCPYGGCTAADEVALADLYDSNSITVLTNKEVVGATATTWDAFVNEVQAKDGWYITLDFANEERLLNRPMILGGALLFTTFKPEGNMCERYKDTASLYGLYYETGTPYYKPILETESYADNKEKCSIKVDLEKGVATEIALHVGKKSGSTGFIQQGSGVIIQLDINPAFNIKSGIIAWMQK